MLRIRQLVLYRDGEKGLLSELSSIQERVAGADAGDDLDKAERFALTDRYTALMQKMIEKAESYGFSGNVWHSFLTYLLVYNENAYSRACEIRGSIDGGLNRIALHDFRIFRELFSYRFTDIEEALDVSLYEMVSGYEFGGDDRRLASRRIRDRIEELSGRLASSRDTEEFKSVHPALYNLLKSSNINSLVGGPLENSGRLTGFLVLLDIPMADQEAAAEVISLLTYFVTQLIAQREEQKHLKYYSYNDPRCGAGNRRAYKEFLDEGLDKSSAFGYVSCRIKDFAEISSNRGYEAGDNVLADTAKCLSEVFGNENVYRLGGGEFAAFGFETDESFFDSDMARAGKLISDRKINVAIGGVYCTYGTMNMNGVVKRAREHTTVN